MLNSHSCVWCILLVLCTMPDYFGARPQIMKPPYASSDSVNEKINYNNATRRLRREAPFRKPPENTVNKTKTRILTHAGYPNRGVAFGEHSDQDIVFPDSYEIVFEPVPRIDGSPKCADGSTFCENFDSYPYHHLKDVLKKTPVYNDLFGTDEIPNEIKNRIGEEEDTFVCGSIDRTIFPKVGKNKNNKWKYIINQGETDGYIQGVRIETCRNQGSPCEVIGELPNGYTTSCKQKYVYRRMLSLTDNGRPTPDTFQLPSACCCSYKRSVEFLARFGAAPVTPASRKT